ncbi:MAG: hypothetical protein A3J79_00180 [Elusimicrobia bacterium RIFOXYB2_FULL_62_6]|nr:MAG: hypothetical protein A3J79_00180 [Elusimicrobia bacterium RIFOXYB2_FULL_62_6]
MLMLKPDENRSLSVIQKDLQKLKIPGLQMAFVTSLLDTGDTDVAEQPPGQLSEEQVLAFTRAETPQDFLLLLFRQNEPLIGKAAESVTIALDDVLNRETSLEQFQASMLWASYDPRIRACWDSFMERQKWEVKDRKKGPLKHWDGKTVVSQAGLFRDADLETLKVRATTEKPEALRLALETIHAVLQRSAGQVLGKLALLAYGRVLAELGEDGDIKSLFSEFKFWQEPKPLSETVLKIMQEKVISPVLATNIIAYLNAQEENTPGFKDIENFMAALGPKSIPFYLEELKMLADVRNRRKLCLILTSVCKRLLNVQPLIPALSDPDWFLVRNVVMILGDVNYPGTVRMIAPSLNHDHQRVREETIRSLGKLGNEQAAAELAAFVAACGKPEETFQAIPALSFLPLPGIDEKLIQAHNGIEDYDTRIAIITALSRVVTPVSLEFLKALAKKSFMELITGRNKVLRNTARESFEKVKGALKT